MPRSDVHRDGLARELGATHYQSAHDEAAAADRAGSHRPERGEPGHARGEPRQYHGRWQQRVGDVMTTPVVTVGLRTPYKRIAALLAQHEISAVPVLVLGRHVAGVVSEATCSAPRKGGCGRPSSSQAATSAGTPTSRSTGA